VWKPLGGVLQHQKRAEAKAELDGLLRRLELKLEIKASREIALIRAEAEIKVPPVIVDVQFGKDMATPAQWERLWFMTEGRSLANLMYGLHEELFGCVRFAV
jgi:hypothetical protein